MRVGFVGNPLVYVDDLLRWLIILRIWNPLLWLDWARRISILWFCERLMDNFLHLSFSERCFMDFFERWLMVHLFVVFLVRFVFGN